MPVPEPQGRTHALAKAGPEETHPAQTRRRKSGSACYSGRHKVAPRATLDRSTPAPSAKSFRHGTFIFKIIFTGYFLAPLAEKPIILLVFFKQNSFPQELPYENHFGTGGSVAIMILLWRFRDHNDFVLEIIFTQRILHVQGSSWRHFVLEVSKDRAGLAVPRSELDHVHARLRHTRTSRSADLR